MSRTALVRYIINYQQALIQTDLLRELWMIPERLIAEDMTKEGNNLFFTLLTRSTFYPGKLFVHQGQFYATISFERTDDHSSPIRTFRVKGDPTGIIYNPKENDPLCTPQDAFILEVGDIANYPDGKPIDTSIGRFIANYVFLVYPFNNVIPYLNEEFTASKLEKKISMALLDNKITVRQVKDKYINSLSLIGQSTEIMAPGITEKTIVIPKSITDLRERLLKENKEALDAGDASVMSSVEQQLIKAYKDHLIGDPSLHFLLKSKYFNVALKKLFLVQGMTEIFGSPGKFNFIDNPMGDGWKQKDLPTIFNEVRQGSYARAVETADGGVIAKLILRVLQDTRITVPDCKTTQGERINGDRNELREFIWNYVVNKDGSTTLITDDNVDQYVDKDIIVRTPGYCQETKGFCAKCYGKMFETLGQVALAPVANDLARAFTTNSLKAMHGKAHAVVMIDDINKYLAG